MRFMMMVIGASSAETAAKMLDYKKSLQKAGVLLAVDALLPPSSGARISYTDGKATVTDGAFGESDDVVSGYWIIQARSREEAIEWARRAPMSDSEAVEVRQIHEMPEDVP